MNDRLNTYILHRLHIHVMHHAWEGAEDQEHQQKIKDDADGYPDQARPGKILFGLVGFAAKSPDTEYDDIDEGNTEQE